MERSRVEKHKRKKEDRRKDASAYIGEVPCDVSLVIGAVTRASNVTLRVCVCVCAFAGASVRGVQGCAYVRARRHARHHLHAFL